MPTYFPVVVPEGDFTPGALATLQFAAAAMNATWEQANTKMTEFEAKIAAMGLWLDPDAPPTMAASSTTAPTVAEPAVTIPESVDTSAILSTYDTKYLELVALIANKTVTFLDDHFPSDAASYEAAESWVEAAIANPNSGLPPAVAAQIWGDDQSRILSDKSRAQDSVLQQFAARRFPLPPGAAASAILQIEQKAQDEIAESSRKVAMLSVEMLKFAIEKAIGMRQIAMQSTMEYIKALMSGPDLASRLVGIGYDAQSKLISAASQFYGARTEAKKLTSMVEQHNSDLSQEAAKENLRSELTIIEDKLKALLTEANAIAQMATSMFNNLHADAGTKYSVSA